MHHVHFSRFFIAVAALLGASAVMFGAYASHGLSAWASPAQVSQVALAAQYQLFHALAIIGVALIYCNAQLSFSVRVGQRLLAISLFSLTLGCILFSGSLYYLVFFGSKLLVLITPAGGLLLILGWLCCALAMCFKAS